MLYARVSGPLLTSLPMYEVLMKHEILTTTIPHPVFARHLRLYILRPQVFSTWILLRCVDFLLKLSACSYFLTVTDKEHVAFVIFLFYIVEEIGRFGLLCHRADLLGKAVGWPKDGTAL